MSSQSYELKDASDSQSDSPVLPRARRGCFIGPVLGFLLTLLAVACAIGVGVLVYFASSRNIQCQCRTNESVEAACMNLASSGDKNVCALCLHKNEEVVTFDVALVKDTRLPTALYPLHYNLEIQTNLLGMDRNNLTFKGYVEIWLRCDVTTDNVTLHVEGLNVNITSVKIKAEREGSNPVVDYYEEDKERMFYIFYLNESMQAGLTYIISMNFSAPIRKDLVGFYSSFYKRNDRNVYLAATQFQVADARKAFPCLDEPGLKATFNITLVRPLHLASLSNMPMLDNSTFL
ncbi:aminopeptidase N-like [Physella acuta]|uniref:aminopeptidase N-like n=1 Tax=Physella acuta TaxID=109671 RepID=UPI0027DC6549|nr:aminopeptidase N-like [Physella acuta]